jgi:hypothetical protein
MYVSRTLLDPLLTPVPAGHFRELDLCTRLAFLQQTPRQMARLGAGTETPFVKGRLVLSCDESITVY